MEDLIPGQQRKENEVELDVSKSLYAPYHPRARRLYNILKKEFGIDVIYKKNSNTW